MSTSFSQQNVAAFQSPELSNPLTVRGNFKGKLGGTQALFAQKQEDREREKLRYGFHTNAEERREK